MQRRVRSLGTGTQEQPACPDLSCSSTSRLISPSIIRRNMRTATATLLGAIICTGAVIGACSDLTTAARAPSAERRAPSLTRSAGVGRTVYTYVEVKKNGRTKRYRVKINSGRRTAEFQSVAEEGPYPTSSVVSACDDPTLPGCETNPEDPSIEGSSGSTGTGILTGELDIDGTVTDSVETDQPWDPSYSTAGWDGTRFHCKRSISGIHFSWKSHYFETQGESYLIGQIPSSIAGVVKGRYALPQGPWLSTDGGARIWSGTVDANCYFEYTTVAGIFLVEYGGAVVYRFDGEYEELGSNANFASNQDGQYGGTVYNSLGALQKGDPEAYAVVKAYLDSGTCTDGWVIVIDGVRVC
jgi:uncharacterized protein YdbL (DUF1318 family)